MEENSRARHNRYEQNKERGEETRREDDTMLATIPRRANMERYGTDSPSPEVYRQAVRAILATPELDGRMNEVTATLFVTVFGSWLAGRMLRSRAFLFFVDVILFLTSLAMAGLLVGIMVGENILPAETIPVLLFVATALVLLIAGFVLGNMLVSGNRSEVGRTRQGAVVSVSRNTRAGRSSERTVYTTRSNR